MRPLFRVASYASVLVIGLGAGYYLGYSSQYGPAFASDMLETAYYSAYLDVQASEGTPAAQEESVRTFLALIQKRRDHRTPLYSDRMLAIDSALANARLAALAEKRGASEEAKQFLAQAVSNCPLMGWKDCSAEKIVEFANRVGAKGLQPTSAQP